MGPLLLRPPSGRRRLTLAHDDGQIRERLENPSHAAAAARMKTLEHKRLADVRLRDDELVNIEIVIILGVGDRRFQAFAHVAGNALTRELKIGEGGRHLLAANELREQIELLRAYPQHAGDRFRLIIGQRTFARLLAHSSISCLQVPPPAAPAAGAAAGAAAAAVRLALRSDEWP